ncbi:hypothetical protein ACQP00_21855 [Dactylosporangium sp. CS-047395]|uniref:hypothetical protein n=1 Tax=Dactylosporangium sp. CS-047395 TaxID=3239936 RepID=UPI003D901E53
MACRTCGTLLNRYQDLNSGQTRYVHPAGVGRGPRHAADPAPLDEVDVRQACDFCSDERVAYTVATEPITTIGALNGGTQVDHYDTEWTACFPCERDLRAGDLDALRRRLELTSRMAGLLDPAIAQVLHQAVRRGLRPGRTLAVTGRWPAGPLPAAHLPRIRDRLAALYGGPTGLPLALDDAGIRSSVAGSIAAARLIWIDAAFTELADHAAGSLPPTVIDPADLPAPHGLLAWAGPAGTARLDAASWTSGPDGVRVIGYRSIGTGLPPRDLQQLREEIGWLIPRVHTRLEPGVPVDAACPVAVLIVTWLLIAQRVAETVPAAIDKTVRKAYLRSGRPAPAVQLVRIRGTGRSEQDRTDDAGRGPGGQERAPRAYRWWVRAHWRQQPYGPGRTLRRPVLVLPQVRGPRDKPIKVSTVVRMLTDVPQRPEAAGPDEPGQ